MPEVTIPQTQKRTQYQKPILTGSVGDILFGQGYRVSYRSARTVWVRRPDSHRYIVNPYEQTCDCPAGQTGRNCKHRKGLTNLVFLSAGALLTLGSEEAASRLFDMWGDYTAWYHEYLRGGK